MLVVGDSRPGDSSLTLTSVPIVSTACLVVCSHQAESEYTDTYWAVGAGSGSGDDARSLMIRNGWGQEGYGVEIYKG